MRKLLLKLIILLMGLSGVGAADIYFGRNDNGTYFFTDTLREGARLLKLKTSHSYYAVKYVYDGDTLTLADNRKIRLLGINTPEIEGRNKSAEAGGEEAKRWLIDALKGQRVRLVTDKEEQDKYGRTLAHVFTEDGRHLNLELLRTGHAMLSLYPPNVLYDRELIAAQREAEQAQRGIWARREYRAKSANNLRAGDHRGWQRIVGKVRDVKTARKFIYLSFNDRVDMRIERATAGLFPDPKRYAGKTVEARGWLNKSKDRLSMLIRHPSAIKVM